MKSMGGLGAALAFLVVVPAAAQAPIRIGGSLGLTGTYAKPGKYAHEGYQLCVKELNARGGILGRRVELVVYDDRSDPQTGLRLYEKLITEDRIDAVIGPYSSPITEAVANVAEKYRKVMITPFAATTSIFKKGRKYLIMMASPAEVFLEGLIELGAQRGLKTVALLNEDTLATKAIARGAAELVRKKGMRVVLQEAYPKGFTDFSSLLLKVKALDPDLLGASTYFDDAVAITRQMKELSVNPRMYGVTVGGDVPEFYELLKQSAEYVYSASQWEPNLAYPGAKEFVEAFRREFGRDPAYFSAAGYAACLLFAEAARRGGTLEADPVRDVLLKLETTTVYGGYKVDADGFQLGHKMVTSQWQDGKKVIVWPENLATGKPRLPTPP